MSAINTLALAIEITDEYGFIKSGHAPLGQEDTRTRIFDRLKDGKVPSDESIKRAEEMKAEFEQSIMIKRLSDEMRSYDDTVFKVLNDDEVTNFNVAVMASIPKAFKQHQEFVARKEQLAKLAVVSEYVGTIKERIESDVNIISRRYVNTCESYVINAVDENDNAITFWSGKDDYVEGKTLKIRGTVKSHEKDKYRNDIKTTTLGRVTLLGTV